MHKTLIIVKEFNTR